jgi:hypothetical protein
MGETLCVCTAEIGSKNGIVVAGAEWSRLEIEWTVELTLLHPQYKCPHSDNVKSPLPEEKTVQTVVTFETTIVFPLPWHEATENMSFYVEDEHQSISAAVGAVLAFRRTGTITISLSW